MTFPYSRKCCAICANFEGRAVTERNMHHYKVDERVRARCCIKEMTKMSIASVCPNFEPLPGFNGR